ncbi:TPA: hypothetical protein PXP51_001796 [Yersinia enterocolitica]|nr:hypothetical protein [Yersinia enterocolitica]
MKSIYTLAGSLFKVTSWKYGRVYVVTAFDFERSENRAYSNVQYPYLKAMYPNIINLNLVGDSLDCGFFSGDIKKRNSLLDVNSNDKLIIVGHSDQYGYLEMSAERLAYILKELNLRQVGVIKLHSCYIGKANWMLEFKNELKYQGINFSYLCGPKGLYCYTPKYARKYKVLAGNISKNFKGTRYTLDNVDAYF